jgi:hypothetical protein
MKTARHCALVVFLVAICTALTWADTPGKHPYYLHALSDLREARALLDRLSPSDKVDDTEQHAINEIDKAINEIKQASIDDGKDLKDHPPIDMKLGHRDRYRKALELIDKVNRDIAREEDDEAVRGLRDRALKHVGEAHRQIMDLIKNAHD